MAIGVTALGSATRGLFRFDLRSLPTNAVVESASLTFHLQPINRVDNAATLHAVHRVTRGWGEGNKIGNQGAAAGDGEATWNHSKFPTTWAMAGADFAGTASGIALMGLSPGFFTIGSSTGLVADVQGWMARPDENFGWLVKVVDEAETLTAMRFSSRETTNSVVLRIAYSVELLEITAVEVVERIVVIRWKGGSSMVTVERSRNLGISWEIAGESANGEFSEEMGTAAFFRLRK